MSRLHSLAYAAANGHISRQVLSHFRQATGLADFTWRIYYHRRSAGWVLSTADLLTNAQGYIVFMPGWTGSHAIWEDLPGLVCQANPRLVCFALDVNGFAGSPFIEAEMPFLELCGPRGKIEEG
jgi:hypothetical protein